MAGGPVVSSFWGEWMDCGDLSNQEHTLLVALCEARNRRTNVVNAKRIPMSVRLRDADVCALLEQGFLDRNDRDYVVLHICPGHPHSLGGLHSSTSQEYICEADVLRRELPVGGPSQEIGEPRPIAGGVRNAANVSLRIETRLQRKIAKRCVDYFAKQSLARYNWATPLSTRGRMALSKFFFEWLRDGAGEIDITMMIEIFFDEIENTTVKSPWRMFIARRFKLVAATKKAKTAREYEQGIKEHGGDFYSKGSGLTAAEVNERLRERLAGDDGE